MTDKKEPTYRIVRFYRGSRAADVINEGLTLEQARRHCNDPMSKGRNWFDGYTIEEENA